MKNFKYTIILILAFSFQIGCNQPGEKKQGGWNTIQSDTQLKDHNTKEIARPNNDSFYYTSLLDLRGEPLILEMPAFDELIENLKVNCKIVVLAT